MASGGHAGGTSGHGGASGSSGATGGAGGVSVVGQGGTGEQAGGTGGDGQQTGGAGGSGQAGGAGDNATGGSTGTGGIDAGAVTGSGGSGDVGGAAGSPDAGGGTGTGGLPDAGGTGTGGDTATGGTTGTGGASGTGGAAGSGGGTGGAPPPSCNDFPPGTSFVTPTDGLLHCYWVHTDQTDWNTAEGECTGERGSLATILSEEENMFVLQVLIQAKVFMMNGVSLGATDGKQSDDKSGPGQYAWVTGEPWGYTNWHSGQPDGSCTCPPLQSCQCDHWLVMISDGTWYDRPESTPRPYICEAIAH